MCEINKRVSNISKRLCVFGIVFVSLIFIPLFMDGVRSAKFNFSDNYGSESKRIFYEENIEKITDVEILRQIAITSMNYTFQQEKIIRGIHKVSKKRLLEHCLIVLSLWIFFIIEYCLIRRSVTRFHRDGPDTRA